MRTDELDFELPEELIARSPADPRDSARLMVVSRSDDSVLHHAHVRDLPKFLSPGDAMVFNTTRVIPARFAGVNLDTGGKVTGLYIEQGESANEWRVLLKMRRHRPGVRVRLGDEADGVVLELIERDSDDGVWRVRVIEAAGGLESVGLVPLPPYILAARRHAGEAEDRAEDVQRYQTVYADEPGSVAAPTAGLHFTDELLARLKADGVERLDVTLHVGRGTFQPVEADELEDHPMHSERCRMDEATYQRLAEVRSSGGRVIPVGSTSCRTIESFAALGGGGEMDTDILISPGYQWRLTDGLMTNFHLPRSTLIAMVAALFPGGADRVREIYAEAISQRYRFFSYGDAMLILP
ncbi:MAG: tRNA preQ1(34) S-adenosylmethionine ribosyltransferase-isomerase QueA [Phycisphaerales bacterium JB061]